MHHPTDRITHTTTFVTPVVHIDEIIMDGWMDGRRGEIKCEESDVVTNKKVQDIKRQTDRQTDRQIYINLRNILNRNYTVN